MEWRHLYVCYFLHFFLHFLIIRFTNTKGLDYLIGSLLSSRAVQDLQKLNPYFSDAKIQHVYDVLVGTILHSNRYGILLAPY